MLKGHVFSRQTRDDCPDQASSILPTQGKILPVNRIGWLDWRGEAAKSEDAKQQIGLSEGDLGGLFRFLCLLMCSLVVLLLDSRQSDGTDDFQAS
jgi:hypothetical protein